MRERERERESDRKEEKGDRLFFDFKTVVSTDYASFVRLLIFQRISSRYA